MAMGPMQASVEESIGGAPELVSTAPLELDQLVRAHSHDVYRFVARLVGPSVPQADIEDLSQQVFVAAHGARHRFRGESKVTTWLYGIASRTVLRYLRGWRRQQRMLDRLRAMTEVANPTAPSPEKRFGDRELLHRVWECLLRVKPKKRLVYVLHEIEGLSIKDVAVALQIKEATAWSRLHHARKELNAALGAKELGR